MEKRICEKCGADIVSFPETVQDFPKGKRVIPEECLCEAGCDDYARCEECGSEKLTVTGKGFPLPCRCEECGSENVFFNLEPKR